MLQLLLFVIFIFTASADPIENHHNSDSSPTGRIVGGHKALIENHPYQVSVQTVYGHWCGGSIISRKYVLTAAHCVFFSTLPLYIRAGSSFHASGGSFHRVVENITHSNSLNADIALLRVRKPFVFDKTRQPIVLFNENEEAKPNTTAVVTGWGTNDEKNSSIITDQLNAVEVSIVSTEICNKIYRNTPIGELIDGQICAGHLGIGGKDSCKGDSGGPLVIDGRQVGIVSTGYGCGQPQYPGIYTDVGYFREWIKNHTSI